MSPTLSHILSKLQENIIISPFIILHGPGVDSQWGSVVQSCQTACGFFAYHDVLEIKDYGDVLGKPHSLKVEYKKNDDSDLLQKQENYEDKGSREINDRLAHAPSGEIKILLIEHLDRATIGAANALLKSLEEPLPNRLIIASTTNKDLLLPTILSRALLIHCDAPYKPASLDEDGQKLLSDTLDALTTNNIPVLSKSASLIAKGGYTDAFLDNLIAYYSASPLARGVGGINKIPAIITTIRMISSNVSAEHSFFNLFLELMAKK